MQTLHQIATQLEAYRLQNLILIMFRWSPLVAQMVQHLPEMRKTWVQSLGQENFSLSISFKFLLVYSCFTMLCEFLPYSKVNQLNLFIYLLFFVFPSHLGHHGALSRVPCAIYSRFSFSYLFYT